MTGATPSVANHHSLAEPETVTTMMFAKTWHVQKKRRRSVNHAIVSFCCALTESSSPSILK